ncbi:MAG: DUF72 domain-containing protein [Bryobacterales bacterium]|nr:DUF72 domain-containing protein [Bryobacterales bacterium]
MKISAMQNLSLFDDPAPELAAKLRPKLASLAAERIYIGASSWKYQGWMGQIYTPEKYLTRGRFSQKKFEAECLAEYAETFPAVCGDFSFYQFPPQAYWQRLFDSSPRQLLFAFKVPEDLTVKRFPTHDRYGARAGTVNETFLNADVFSELFAKPLDGYRERVAALIFEFGAFGRSAFDGEPPFVEQLDRFLRALPEGFRYAVEVRNPELLDTEYFCCLRSHGVAHVFNAWTRMPELAVQAGLPAAHTADFTVVRALLRQGRTYEEAVNRFQPYLHVQDPNPAAREAVRNLIGRARTKKQMAFFFVNNRLEGNAPETISAIVDDIG